MTRKRVRPTGSIRHLAARIFNTPLLIEPKKMDAILAVLGPRLGLRADMIPDFPDFGDDDEPLEEMPDDEQTSVCVIPIYGTLVKRTTGMDAMSGLTSYDSIQSEIQEALDDPSCSGIVLDIDSPGGEASGMFDLANYIESVRGQKPIIGIANDSAYSAAYCLAACCDKLLVTSVGGVGSIGCYMLHCDQSKFDAKVGVEYTYIYAGDKKVDGNPHEPLSKAALAETQAEVDRIRDMFAASVSKNRNVDIQKILDTQAGTFMGADACPMLADGVGTLQDAIELAMGDGEASDDAEMSADVRRDAVMAIQARGYKDHMIAVRKFGTSALASIGGKEKVTGILAPYNSLSLDLGGFQEIYQPGCFEDSLKSGDDFRVLFNHNPDMVLGRRSAGTARFWEEADGLHYEADIPDTQAGRDLKISMERGDIRESSAAFYILQNRWEQRSTGRVRIVERAKLVEGSPASFAAYESSSAATIEQEQIAASADYELELLGARLQMLRV